MKRAPKSVVRVDVLDSSDPISAEAEAILSRIRQRAFELSHTRPHDAHERYDWIMAESETIVVPPVVLIENDWTVDVKFAVPGVGPESLTVMITPDQILLKSESTENRDTDYGTIHVNELKSKTIFRSVNLPTMIDVNTVKTSVADGLVLVTASKARPHLATTDAEPAAPPKRTSVRKTTAKKSQAKTP